MGAASVLVLLAYIYLAEIPIRVSWTGFTTTYWIGMAFPAIFAAALLCALQWPGVLKRCWQRYCAEKSRFLIIGSVGFWLLWWLGIGTGIVATVVAIAVAEFFDAAGFDIHNIGRHLRNFLPPAVYFFFGLILVLTYNDIVVSISLRYFDDVMLRADRYILAGSSVSNLSHMASGVFPSLAFRVFDAIYFGMFTMIGAALILVALLGGRKEACRYVGTLLMAYYTALLIFYIYPTLSPFYLCADHSSHLPVTNAGLIQQALLSRTASLRGAFALNVEGDYNIAFPCMHIALPFIAWWFCRAWKRIARAIFIYNLALIPSILLLEWHYLVDILGGIFVAFAVILMTHVSAKRLWPLKSWIEFNTSVASQLGTEDLSES
jgi:hypothetical protein